MWKYKISGKRKEKETWEGRKEKRVRTEHNKDGSMMTLGVTYRVVVCKLEKNPYIKPECILAS